MKEYGYRLKVKIDKKWYHGKVKYNNKIDAQNRMKELIILGHPAKEIKIEHESEIFC